MAGRVGLAGACLTCSKQARGCAGTCAPKILAKLGALQCFLQEGGKTLRGPGTHGGELMVQWQQPVAR